MLIFVARQVASAVELKRNELALRRSEARYRSLVQSSVYGIFRSSLEGRFLDVNPALITMLGYDSAEEVLLLDPEKDVFAQAEEHERLHRAPYNQVHRADLHDLLAARARAFKPDPAVYRMATRRFGAPWFTVP